MSDFGETNQIGHEALPPPSEMAAQRPPSQGMAAVLAVLASLSFLAIYAAAVGILIWSQKGNATGRQARAAFYRGDYEEAENLYDLALAKRPGDQELLLGKSKALSALERYDEAVETLDQVIQNNPVNTEAMLEKANLLVYNLKRYDEAAELGKKITHLEPRNARGFYLTGVALDESGESERAIPQLKVAISISREYAPAYRSIGHAYQHIEKYEDAANSYQKAIDLNPNDSWSWAHKGACLNQIDKTDEALEACKKAVELDPDFGWAQAQLGAVYYSMKEYEKAVNAYQKAIDKGSDDPATITRKAKSLIQLGEYQEAIEVCDNAAMRYKDSPYPYQEKGRALRKQKDYAASETAYRKALELGSTEHFVYEELGDDLYDLGRYAEAVSMYDAGLKWKPTCEYSINQREKAAKKVGPRFRADPDDKNGNAIVSHKNGNLTKSEFEKLKKLTTPTHLIPSIEAYEIASKALWENDFEKANKYADLFLELLPLKNPDIMEPGFMLKAAIELKQKRYDDAIARIDDMYGETPNSPMLNFLKACAYGEKEEWPQAYKFMDIAIDNGLKYEQAVNTSSSFIECGRGLNDPKFKAKVDNLEHVDFSKVDKFFK